MFATLTMIAACGLMADGVSMKFVPSGATAKVGGYSPIRAEMNDKADSVKKAPEGLTAAKYGELKIGDKSFAFILDEPEGKPAKLVVDSNGDGDLTNDGEAKWASRDVGGLTQYSGSTQVDLGGGKMGAVNMYRFDPNDPRRPTLKNTLLYYADYGNEVTLSLDGKDYTTFVAGQPQATTRFWVDRDGNKQRSMSKEIVTLGKPFNFTGTTYELSLKGGELALNKSAETLPQAPLPPDFTIGKKVLPFEATTLDGKKIDFPKTYAGKLVMLDFWATWCGPCIAELPNVKKAYADWHDKGFEILGVSFDAAGMEEKLKAFAAEHETPWAQIYEGKSWNTSIGDMYDVTAIPFVLLVDGDTGEILGTARELRGPGCSEFIGKALAKKNARN